MTQNFENPRAVLIAHFEDVLPVAEIQIFQRKSAVCDDAIFVFDGLSAISRALKIIPQVNLLRGLEDVVHDAEVDLLLHLASLAGEDHLMQAKSPTDHGVSVLLSQVLMVVL